MSREAIIQPIHISFKSKTIISQKCTYKKIIL